MSGLLDTLRSWVKEEAEHYTYAHIPDPAAEVDHLLPYGSYFRLTLAQMFLSTRREWFREVFPAAHTSVRIQHADYEAVELTHVTHVPGSDLARGVSLNSAVTGLIPYNGGTLEIDCGLLALHGKDHLDGAIKMLSSFSDLVAAPVSQAVAIAGKVGASVQDLFTRGNGEVQLNFGQTFAEGAPPRAGHYAVVLATAGQLKGKTLSVAEGQLMANRQPLVGFDFLLFRLDAVKERKDWRIKEVQRNLTAAKKAYLKKKSDEGDDYRAAALVAVYDSPDLTEVDRARVEQAIRDELEPFRQGGQGLRSDLSTTRDLNAMMKDAPTWTEMAGKLAARYQLGGSL